ncbi:hypothetical protein NW762_007944 [Fusarium torreyae]|uniref:Uncharacterized protein n=1 Tax=Fusarium torreyae TaxID=1237075 RepID=A0A9W8RY11_9HYPO|nr:hypothetical protein NW762_007944 [Fusarium torreyae]
MSSLGLMNLTLGVEYNGEGDHIYDYVIEDDYKTHASTWWGTRLMNAYFTGILTTMSQTQRTSDGKYWSIGRISYTRNPTKTNIRELSFFNLGGWFLSSNGFINGNTLNDTAFIRDNPELFGGIRMDQVFNMKQQAEFVPVATEALHFARILHSLVAVDLGNRHAPNLLLEEDELRYAILPSDDPNRQSGGFLNGSNSCSRLANATEEQRFGFTQRNVRQIRGSNGAP